MKTIKYYALLFLSLALGALAMQPAHAMVKTAETAKAELNLLKKEIKKHEDELVQLQANINKIERTRKQLIAGFELAKETEFPFMETKMQNEIITAVADQEQEYITICKDISEQCTNIKKHISKLQAQKDKLAAQYPEKDTSKDKKLESKNSLMHANNRGASAVINLLMHAGAQVSSDISSSKNDKKPHSDLETLLEAGVSLGEQDLSTSIKSAIQALDTQAQENASTAQPDLLLSPDSTPEKQLKKIEEAITQIKSDVQAQLLHLYEIYQIHKVIIKDKDQAAQVGESIKKLKVDTLKVLSSHYATQATLRKSNS